MARPEAWDEICDSFDDMNLRESLLRGIYAYGFEKPNGVQMRAVEPYLQGRNVIVQTQSGQGKKSTYVLGLLQNLDLDNPQCQALVLASSHERAARIKQVVAALGDYMNVECTACTADGPGELKAGTHCVVGHPSSITAMVQQGKLSLASVRQVIVDSADTADWLGREVYGILLHPDLNSNHPAPDAIATKSLAASQLWRWWSHPEQDGADGRAVCKARHHTVWAVMHVARRLETASTSPDLTDFLPSEMWMLILTFVKNVPVQIPFCNRESARGRCWNGEAAQSISGLSVR